MAALMFYTLVLLAEVFAATVAEYRGKYISDIEGVHPKWKVSGGFFLVNETHLCLEDFSYDGTAPDAYFKFTLKNETNSVTPNGEGRTLPDEHGSTQPLKVYEHMRLLLPLPCGIHASDIRLFYLWCARGSVALGYVVMPDFVAVPSPVSLGKFIVRDSAITKSGEIIVQDHRTFLINNLHYSGSDDIFVMGGGKSNELIQLPDEKGSLKSIHAYGGESITIRVPKGKSIIGQNYFAIYCRHEKTAIARVIIPHDLNIPPYLEPPPTPAPRFIENNPGFTAENSPCSPEHRARNLEGCLAAIREKATDDSYFPFGKGYSERCPPEKKNTIDCFQPVPKNRPYTLSELVFRVPNQDLSSLDRFISITYDSPAGSYTGCDHTYNYPNHLTFTVDPLSQVKHHPWNLRLHPTPRFDYKDDELYTLIKVEPNGWNTHGVVVNIRGNDIPNALHLQPYVPPINGRRTPKVIAVVLYKQTTIIGFQRIPLFKFNITEFAERNHLGHPIAFSWFGVTYDAYGVSKFPWATNCASLVEDAVRPYLYKYPFLPGPEEIDLNVFLRVRFTSPEYTFNCHGPWGYNTTRPATDFYLDPIDLMHVNTADVRRGVNRTYEMIVDTIGRQPNYFDGKLYTMMILGVPTKEHGPFLQGFGFNIPKGDHLAGNIMFPLYGLSPFDTGEREQIYLFLLYEQQGRIPERFSTQPYEVLPCLERGRCIKDVKDLIYDLNLKLVGLSKLKASYDEYARCVTRPSA